MRPTRAAWLAALGVLALGAPLGAGAEPVEDERIGRYRVTRSGDGVVLASPRDRSFGLALAAGGAALAALGAGLSAAGRRGPGLAAVVAGVGLAAMGAFAAFGTTRVRANRVELVREGFAGRSERWPRAAIAGLDVARRRPSAEDFKQARARSWDVRLRTPDGRLLPVRFALASEREARALARVLGEALGVP